MASVAELDVLIKMQTEGQQSLSLFNGQLLTAAVALGAVYEVGKSVVTNYEDQQKALKNLESAFASTGREPANWQQQLQGVVESDKRFVSNTNDVVNALAMATRAGFDWATAQRIANDAVNLSIAKNIDVASATTMLIDAENGRATGLLSLGIAIKNVTDPQKDLEKATKDATKADQEKAVADRSLQEELDRLHAKHTVTQADLDILADKKAKDLAATQADTTAHQDLAAAQQELIDKGNKYNQVLDQVEAKTGTARQSETQLEQDQNQLNNDWAAFSSAIGPGVVTTLDAIVQAADIGVQILGELNTIINDIANDPSKLSTALQAAGLQNPNQAGVGNLGGRGSRPGPNNPSVPQQPSWTPPAPGQTNNYYVSVSGAAAVSRLLRSTGAV